MKAFVDTNVLVYAYDRGAGSKHERALSLVENLWKDGSGVLSTQVLQEFYVNVRRKAQKPISHDQARALITDYLSWDPVVRHTLHSRDEIIPGKIERFNSESIYPEVYRDYSVPFAPEA